MKGILSVQVKTRLSFWHFWGSIRIGSKRKPTVSGICSSGKADFMAERATRLSWVEQLIYALTLEHFTSQQWGETVTVDHGINGWPWDPYAPMSMKSNSFVTENGQALPASPGPVPPSHLAFACLCIPTSICGHHSSPWSTALPGQIKTTWHCTQNVSGQNAAK